MYTRSINRIEWNKFDNSIFMNIYIFKYVLVMKQQYELYLRLEFFFKGRYFLISLK